MERFFDEADMAGGTSGTLCNGLAHRVRYQVQSTLKHKLIKPSAMSGVVGAIDVIVDCPSAQGSRAKCRALAPSVRRKHIRTRALFVRRVRFRVPFAYGRVSQDLLGGWSLAEGKDNPMLYVPGAYIFACEGDFEIWHSLAL